MNISTKRKNLSLEKQTVIMGVLNITPDSFYDGGSFFNNIKSAVMQAKNMLDYGADIIDIGGESTRPGADQISSDEELRRVIPVIESIRKELGEDFVISIDTYKSVVAREALKKGADIINDVSGLQLDVEMPSVAAETGVPIIITHMRGNPKTMQQGEIVYHDIIEDIAGFFTQQINSLCKKGVARDMIILDPGFGFGKTMTQNIEIVQRLAEFNRFKLPLLLGISRKSTLGKILQEISKAEPGPSSHERLESSLAASALAILHGATIIRTHDVKETALFIDVFNYIRYA